MEELLKEKGTLESDIGENKVFDVSYQDLSYSQKLTLFSTSEKEEEI